MLGLLLQNNALPYIAIVLLGGLLYWQTGKIAEQAILIDAKDASIELTATNMAIMHTYTNTRIDALEKVKKTKWKKGKHESSF